MGSLCFECASESRWPCFQVQIWSNHWGYFQLRLCPLSSTSNAAEKAELTEGCLNKHALPLSGGQGSKYWIYKVGLSLLLWIATCRRCCCCCYYCCVCWQATIITFAC